MNLPGGGLDVAPGVGLKFKRLSGATALLTDAPAAGMVQLIMAANFIKGAAGECVIGESGSSPVAFCRFSPLAKKRSRLPYNPLGWWLLREGRNLISSQTVTSEIWWKEIPA